MVTYLYYYTVTRKHYFPTKQVQQSPYELKEIAEVKANTISRLLYTKIP